MDHMGEMSVELEKVNDEMTPRKSSTDRRLQKARAGTGAGLNHSPVKAPVLDGF